MARRPQGTGSLYQRGGVWWCQYYRHGQRFRESTGERERDAAQRFLHRRLGVSQLEPGKVTVSDLVDLVIEDYEFRRLASSKEAGWIAAAHLKPLLGQIQAAKLGAADVRRYVSWRRKSVSDATINRELSIVRRAFRIAAQQDPPLVSRELHIPKLREDNVRQGFLEPAQYERLLQELPERLRALYVCAYHVGTRKGELRQVQWSQVDFESGQIRLAARQTKARTARTLPIYGDMERWLRRQRESCPPGCPWVFHSRRVQVGEHLEGWREACVRAGLPGLLFHDLRRSAVRNMKRAGVQDKAAMAISGHKTRAIFDRYNIVDEADVADAAEKLEQYLQSSRATKPALQRVK